MILVLFVLLAVPVGAYAVLGTFQGSRPAEQNLAETPKALQGDMQWLFPKDYVVPTVVEVGSLKSMSIARGILSDSTTIETTDGFFTVAGLVNAATGAPVTLSGTEEDQLEDRLCIGSGSEKCYRLISH